MRRRFVFDEKLGKVIEIDLNAELVPNRCRSERYAGVTTIMDIPSFVTEHITGKPIEVRSRRHKKQVLKEKRLVEYSTHRSSKNRKGLTKKIKKDDNFNWEKKNESIGG